MRNLPPVAGAKDPQRIHVILDAEIIKWYKGQFGKTIGFSAAINLVLTAWKVAMESKAEAQAQE